LSADGDVARKAVEIGEYDTLQITYNILQPESADIIAAAREKEMGIIIKNPIANAIYEKPRPTDSSGDLWDCGQAILAPECVGDLSRVEVALRWLLHDLNVHTAIVGTTNIHHLEANVSFAESGDLGEEMLAEIGRRFEQALVEREK